MRRTGPLRVCLPPPGELFAMRPFVRRATALPAVLGVVALAATACHHPPPPAAAPAPVQPVADHSAELARLRETLGQMTFFDFDRSDLTPESRSILDAKIPILNANPQIRIRINGNCDDRGSDEYNLALGQRRAAMAKRYLTDHGVDASRIEIISFGKERPIAQGNSEDSWAKNRNDQYEIIAGGDQLHAGM